MKYTKVVNEDTKEIIDYCTSSELLNTFKDKTVLVTGHTGFKGSWLSIWLTTLGAKVVGYSLDPYSKKGNYCASHLDRHIFADLRGDMRDGDTLEKAISKYQPEIIFHLAAQALVRTAYANPKYTYETRHNIALVSHILPLVLPKKH